MGLKKAGTFNFNFRTRMTHHAAHAEGFENEGVHHSESRQLESVSHNGSQRFSNRVSINGTLYKVVEKSVKELDQGSYFGEIALIIDR